MKKNLVGNQDIIGIDYFDSNYVITEQSPFEDESRSIYIHEDNLTLFINRLEQFRDNVLNEQGD
tara:strand:+ start:245 stop:436 length:192 start_codon:yes stop_codon:yes gene_type:complete